MHLAQGAGSESTVPADGMGDKIPASAKQEAEQIKVTHKHAHGFLGSGMSFPLFLTVLGISFIALLLAGLARSAIAC